MRQCFIGLKHLNLAIGPADSRAPAPGGLDNQRSGSSVSGNARRLKVSHKQPKRGRLWLADGSCIRLRPEQRKP
jgi:hypothetical protein